MEIILVVRLGEKHATSIKREEARDAAKHSTIHRTAPQQKLSASKVNSEKTEKCCFKGIIISFVKSLNFLKTIG